MPQQPALLQRAQERVGKSFTVPDFSKAVPPGMQDTVERVVAAAMRIMYAPQTKEDLMAAVQGPEPAAKKMAENVTGLLLTLDGKMKGGIPSEALMPAAMHLLGEAGQLLVKAGQPVSQQDFNDSALMAFSLIGQKLGASPEDIMGAAEQQIAGPTAAAPPGASPGASPGAEAAPQGEMPA